MNLTLAKTCTYSVMHLTVAIAVAYALTRDWRIALAVGMVEPLVQTVAFAIHERIWNRLGVKAAGRGCGAWRARGSRRDPEALGAA